MARAFAVGARTDGDFVHGHGAGFQSLGEGTVWAGRPVGDHAARLQRRPGRGDPLITVQSVIGRAHQPVGAVIDIEQDGVEPSARLADRLTDIAQRHRHARIVEAAIGQRFHRAACPIDDLRHQLHHLDRRFPGKRAQRSAEREAHAIAADQPALAGASLQAFRRHGRQGFLAAAHPAVHQLVAVQHDDMIITASVEFQVVPTGDMGGIEMLSWCHAPLLPPHAREDQLEAWAHRA